jgi:DNA-binding winged helix-turn-helix (wHTH) protein/Tol biopolymer transport system component
VKVVKSPANVPAEPADSYEFGVFRLDYRTRELRRGDEVVPLTLKAFELLRVLVAAGGRVVEKSALMKLVWPDSFVSDDSLTHHIAVLRKALGDTPDRPQYILTVPRYGYRFVAPVRTGSEASQAALTNDSVTTAEGPEQPSGVAAVAVPAYSPPRAGVRWGFVWTVLAMLLLLGVGAAVWLLQRPPSTGPLPARFIRFIVEAPQGTAFSASASLLAVSLDGRLLAFVAARPGEHARLWVRPLESLTPRELPGTDGALNPFWSPDSQSLGFTAGDKLKTVSLLGEPPRVLWTLQPGVAASPNWSRQGVILFSQADRIFRISATGGVPTPVTSVDASRGEAAHLHPQFLPDGQHFLYVARGPAGSLDSWIVLGSLDGSAHRRLIRASSQAIYAEPGYLLFLRDGALVAQPFDAMTLQLAGAPLYVAEADHVGFNPATPRGMFSVSATGGTLAYRPAAVRELGWYDRTGRPLGSIGAAGRDSDPALSPDEQRIAVSRYDPATSTRKIWIIDARTGLASSLTPDHSWATCPVWSADSTRVFFASGTTRGGRLHEKPVDGRSQTRALTPEMTGCPLDRLPDGGLLFSRSAEAFASGSNGRQGGLWAASVSAGIEPKRLAADVSDGAPRWARLSPDTRWLAYVSDASGRNEVYVRPLPDDEPQRISMNGGIEPQWRADGRELYFISSDKSLMAVSGNGGLRTGTPEVLFVTSLDPSGLGISGRNQYVPSASGDRFLINQSPPNAPTPPVVVLSHWTTALRP